MRIIYGLLCLCFLIFFHELGHFVFARFFRVKVNAFSIGFGPVIFHKQHNGTDYRLSLIPLGGYCAMKGEQDFRNALDSGLDYIAAERDSLYGIHPIKRALIAFAGPMFNLFFAVISFTIIALSGYFYYSYSNIIKIPSPIDNPEVCSISRDAGLKTGDKIIEINGKPVNDFSDLISEIGTRPEEKINLTVLRNDEKLTFLLKTELDKKTGSGKIGIMADTTTLERKEKKPKWIIPAVIEGFTETGKAICLTIKGFMTLFKGVEVKESVSGPARIADMMGGVLKESFSESFRAGIVNMFSFMAIISISLGIMNLLPVPILDGGLILFALIEFFANRKLSPKVLYYIQFVGLGFVAILFFIGLNGDIRYFVNLFKESH